MPPALKPSFKAHQDHVEQIIDVLGGVIILYPDNLITFSLEKNFTPTIIRPHATKAPARPQPGRPASRRPLTMRSIIRGPKGSESATLVVVRPGKR